MYRTLFQMYSGYFHHEIKKNLLNAEEMFIAMGYKKNPNEVLVLDEPICQDQVANVSRDCMIAYVECSIMMSLKSSMSEMKLAASWKDILRARETVVGEFFFQIFYFRVTVYYYLVFAFESEQ